MATTTLYPLATKEELIKQFVGESLKDVATPAAVLDLSKLKNNCNRMLEAVDSLKFGWRAHIKTHKVRLIAMHLLIFCVEVLSKMISRFNRGWSHCSLLKSTAS
jgi:hypothetical protein